MANGLFIVEPTSVTAVAGSVALSANGTIEYTGSTTSTDLYVDGVFSSAYDSYMIIGDMVGKENSSSDINLLLRSGGVTTTTNYAWNWALADGTGRTGTRYTTLQYMPLAYLDGTLSANERNGFVAYIHGPYLAESTTMRTCSNTNSNTAILISDYASTQTDSTSFDGFRITSGVACNARFYVLGIKT